VPGYGMDPAWWPGARVLFAMLPYVPITGFKPKCRVQSPGLQMHTAIFGCIATNLDSIHCQQELKPEMVLVCATLIMGVNCPLLLLGRSRCQWCSSTARVKSLSAVSQVVIVVPLQYSLKQIQVCLFVGCK